VRGLATALATQRRAEGALADALRRVGDAHADEPDVRSAARLLADLSDGHDTALAAMCARYPLADDGDPGTLPAVPGRSSLVRDLQDLHGLACWVDLGWDVLGRAAAALRDRDLVGLTTTGSRDALRQVRWLRSRTELAAAQALVLG
jgi:hypothetical protein